jgi:CheY-like chemotaxis protein
MSDSQTAPIRVLFVDDDAPFLEMVNQLAGEHTKGSWQVHVAQDATSALKILKEHAVELVVLDFYMPAVSGLQLLQSLNLDFPRLPKVFLSGATDENTRVTGLESGAELFLEKPVNLVGMLSVFATLTELVKWRRKQGARAVPWLVRLLDIVKLECASGNSRLLEVSAGGVPGQIFIKAGSIIHAQTEGRRGQSAFTHLASFLNAEFSLRQFVEPPEQSIDRQWEFLVLEAFRLQEQLAQQAPADGEENAPPAPSLETAPVPRVATAASRSAASASPPLTPESKTTAPRPSVPAAPLRMATESASLRDTPSAETLQREAHKSEKGTDTSAATQEDDTLVVNSTPATLTLAAAGDQAAFRIEELLICSSQREVLCEWRCTRSEERIRFVQAVSEQSHELGKALKLGNFDRVEFLAAQHRMVVQLRGDSSILMRSNTRGREMPPVARVPGQTLDEWLDLQLQNKGVLACGVIRPGGISVNRSRSPDFTIEIMGAAWRRVVATFEITDQNGFSASAARWIYDQAQLYSLKRVDRVVLGVFLNKDPQAVDVTAVERSFTDFNSMPAV